MNSYEGLEGRLQMSHIPSCTYLILMAPIFLGSLQKEDFVTVKHIEIECLRPTNKPN